MSWPGLVLTVLVSIGGSLLSTGLPVSDLTEPRFVHISLRIPDGIFFKMSQHLMLNFLYETPQPSAYFQLETERMTFPSID